MALQSLSAIERYKKKNKASFFPKLPQATRTQVTRIKDNDKTVSFGMSVIGAWDRVVYSFSFEDFRQLLSQIFFVIIAKLCVCNYLLIVAAYTTYLPNNTRLYVFLWCILRSSSFNLILLYFYLPNPTYCIIIMELNYSILLPCIWH